MNKTLYLMRHGHVDSKGRLLGQADILLSEQGQKQAKYWQETLADVNFQAIWCSPLQRSVQTAEIIIFNKKSKLQMHKVQDLREISLGLWNGKSKDWIKNNYPELWAERGLKMDSVVPPEGESFANLAQRVLPAFLQICEQARQYDSSLLVAHQAVNRVIIAYLLNIPLININSIFQPYASLNLIELSDGIKFIATQQCKI